MLRALARVSGVKRYSRMNKTKLKEAIKPEKYHYILYDSYFCRFVFFYIQDPKDNSVITLMGLILLKHSFIIIFIIIIIIIIIIGSATLYMFFARAVIQCQTPHPRIYVTCQLSCRQFCPNKISFPTFAHVFDVTSHDFLFHLL